mmetsp:Transcript_12181/g.28587  ORF Transcript_12181/g.28587 Transcript_12181/m.28587 type:complete len:204 (-) Transcript_12181:1244-1855(-)
MSSVFLPDTLRPRSRSMPLSSTTVCCFRSSSLRAAVGRVGTVGVGVATEVIVGASRSISTPCTGFGLVSTSDSEPFRMIDSDLGILSAVFAPLLGSTFDLGFSFVSLAPGDFATVDLGVLCFRFFLVRFCDGVSIRIKGLEPSASHQNGYSCFGFPWNCRANAFALTRLREKFLNSNPVASDARLSATYNWASAKTAPTSAMT